MQGRFRPVLTQPDGQARRPVRRTGRSHEKRPAVASRPGKAHQPRRLDRAGTAGTGRAAAAAAAQLQAGSHRKAHVGHIDLQWGSLLVKLLLDDKGVSGNVEHLVRFARLIQSQRQSRTRSAARRQVNTDRGLFLVGEIPIQLGLCRFRQLNHGNLHRTSSFNATKHDRSESQIPAAPGLSGRLPGFPLLG